MSKRITLVADVGGTNTRLALADDSGLMTGSTQRFPNDTLDSFEDAVARFLADKPDLAPEGLCIAIAGPVTDGNGKLTNRAHWKFNAADMTCDLNVGPVFLINDLAALGYALPDLPERMLDHIGGADAKSNQALVVGIATGFNVALCQGDQVYEAELGHASLPSSVMQVLLPRLGDDAYQIKTVESLFSGSGLEAFHTRLGNPALGAADITAKGGETVDLFARALGVLCRELTYQYMPLGGLYFNGSLARAIVQGAGIDTIVNETSQDATFAGRFGQVPLHVITEDTAALYGCARFLRLNAGG